MIATSAQCRDPLAREGASHRRVCALRKGDDSRRVYEDAILRNTVRTGDRVADRRSAVRKLTAAFTGAGRYWWRRTSTASQESRLTPVIRESERFGPAHNAAMHTTLVGSDIPARLAELAALSRDGFCLVTVEGPAGSGKSRLVRELYQSIRANQPAGTSGGYWPSIEPDDDDPAPRPLRTRKVLGPSRVGVAAPPGAVPTSLWLWTSAGLDSTGSPISTMRDLSDQISLHSAPLLAHALAQEGISSRLRSAQREFLTSIRSDLRDEAMSELTLKLIEQLVGGAIPGGGLILQRARRLIDRAGRNRALDTAVQQGWCQSVGREELATSLAETIDEISDFEIHTTIAIEDAHYIDPEMAGLLLRLSTSGANVLVIATVWPESASRDPLASLTTEMGKRGQHLRLHLPHMALRDREQVFHQYVPHADKAVADAVLKSLKSPLALELFLSLDLVQSRIHDGRLALTAEQVAHIRPDLNSLYEQRWDELGRPVQCALALAMAASDGRELGPATGAFVRNVVMETADRFRPADPISSGLTAASEGAGWLDERMQEVLSYPDPLLAHLVVSKLPMLLLDDEIDRVASICQEVLRDRVDAIDPRQRPHTEAQVFAADWYLRLSQSTIGSKPTQSIARVLVAGRLFRQQDLPAAAKVLSADPPESSSSPRLRVAHFELAIDVSLARGDVPSALRWYAEAISAHDAWLGERSEGGIRLRTKRAYWLRNVGSLRESLAMYEAAGRLSSGLSDVVSLHLEAQAGAAIVRGTLAGTPGEVARELVGIAAQARDEFGPGSLFVLNLLRQAARWQGTAGMLQTACFGLEECLRDLRRVWGRSHPETLFALSNLAYFTWHRGELEEAIRLFRDLHQRRSAVLGEGHPHTIDTLRHLTAAELTHSSAAEKLPKLRAHVEFLEQHLPVQHAIVVEAYLDLALALSESGHGDEADRVVFSLDARFRDSNGLLNRDALTAALLPHGRSTWAETRIVDLGAIDQDRHGNSASMIEEWRALLDL